MDRLLNKTEVCEKLQISRATLDRIVAVGDLEAMKIGGQVRFAEQDLLRYLCRCREETARRSSAGAKKEPARRGRPKGSRKMPAQLEYIPGMKVV